VGLIAREIEGRGIPTVCLSSALSITASVKPPRAVFVDYPLGHTAGPRDDQATQQTIARAALEALADEEPPGAIRRLPLVWPDGEAWKTTAMRPDPAGRHSDERSERSETPQYQCDADRLAAEGAH
jgi:hypothetical protein